jgi:LuxR family maltose regulon positive regulatory protein
MLIELVRIGIDRGLFETVTDLEGDQRVLLLKLRSSTANVYPATSTPSLPDTSMTARERSVLQLIGRGLSNKKIARDLNIAPETVKSHTKNIFCKLGTSTRAQAVACAARLGLL